MYDGTATRQRWNLPLSVPLLLHVGRLDLEKQADGVILAAAGVLRQTEAHLVIVGDGSQRGMLSDLCQELDIADRVHFTGFIPASAGLPELYRVASLFVTASQIETQGIVMLEAAASGLPIVAVRAGSAPEIVHDEINGFLVEPGDTSGMSQAMMLLLKNPSLAGRLGRASRSLAEEHRQESTLDAHETLYRATLRRKCIGRVSWPAVDTTM
jgi:glycosyltransferase involved in cell wall biosynthesis